VQYTTLGRTGITVSRLCMGTMTFGREADEATSAALFARCREAGINFFDCADLYAQGASEEILSRLARECRDELVLTSKVGFEAGMAPPNNQGLSRRHILRAVEASLRRMGTEWLDVYFCHRWDGLTPVEETLRALDDLVRQGKVRYVGVSNWMAWQVARTLGEAERLGTTPIHVLQPMYSLVKRTAEVELLPMAQAEGLGVISYSPLGAGLLTGKYAAGVGPSEGRLNVHDMYTRRYAPVRDQGIAERFTAHAQAQGVHPVTLAIAWVKAHPAVTAPIIGARSVEQLEPALAAADYAMSAEERQAISDLTPPVPIATDRDEERS
jgi:aryl-alcohol dehydrogenase-like predicted oxidoreductase